MRILALLSLCLLTACVSRQPSNQSAASEADAAFTRLADEFLAGFLAWRPQAGTGLGLHDYDGRITDYGRASLDAELARLKSFDRRLDGLNPAALSPRSSYDYRILRAAVRKEIFKFEERLVFTEKTFLLPSRPTP